VAVLSAVAEPVEAIADKGGAGADFAVSSPNKLVASAGSATAMLSPELGIRLCVAEIVVATCAVAVLSAVAEPVEAIADKGVAAEAIADSAVAFAVAELAEAAEAIADKGEVVETVVDRVEAAEAISELREAARLFDNSFNNSVSPLINASFFFLFQP
jgi:N-acyl-D-aspartate/D-glutamate deacylase